MERSSGGIRMFRENDFEWLQVIRCMKKAGMSIKDIRQYIELSMQGDGTIDTRLEMFSYSIRWRPWSINAGSMKPPKPLGQWMSPVQ